jgi:VWFA-related protein
MRRSQSVKLTLLAAAAAFFCLLPAGDFIAAQGARRGPVRPVTIPVTVRLDEGGGRRDEEFRTVNLVVREDGERQEILAVRGAADRSPLYLAVLVQDDLVPSVATEISAIASFIRRLPEGSQVLVGYMRTGSIQIRQKFTPDLERAARALRIPAGTPNAGPYNPFAAVREALKRFQSQPVGRRAMLVISDGLDVSRGVDSSRPGQSFDLQRAVEEAQRRGVAIYTIFAPTYGSDTNRLLAGNGQGSLARLSEETGGHSFNQLLSAPVSFEPFLRRIETRLARQIALTYLSTHADKGYHRIKIEFETALSDVDIAHPAGYRRQ